MPITESSPKSTTPVGNVSLALTPICVKTSVVIYARFREERKSWLKKSRRLDLRLLVVDMVILCYLWLDTLGLGESAF